MTFRFARSLAVTATAVALCLGGAASAQDMSDYIDMFEPLPAMPPIPAGTTMSAERIDLGRILGHDFEDAELDDLVAFLDALTGEMPRVEIPALP